MKPHKEKFVFQLLQPWCAVSKCNASRWSFSEPRRSTRSSIYFIRSHSTRNILLPRSSSSALATIASALSIHLCWYLRSNLIFCVSLLLSLSMFNFMTHAGVSCGFQFEAICSFYSDDDGEDGVVWQNKMVSFFARIHLKCKQSVAWFSIRLRSTDFNFSFN